MNKKYIAAGMLAAFSVLHAVCAVGEEPATERVTEMAEQTAAPDFTLTFGTEQISVANHSAYVVNEAIVEVEEKATEEDAETGADTAAVSTVLITGEEDSHVLTGAGLEGLSDLVLTQKLGYLYLTGTDAAGQNTVFMETGDEITLSEPVTFYTINLVNIRSEASADSEVAGTAALNSEVEVLGGTPSWFHIRQGDTEGYINQAFLTEDPLAAQAAQTAEDQARAAAAAAAAAAAQAAAQSGGSSSAGSSSSGAGSSGSDNACLDGGVLY